MRYLRVVCNAGEGVADVCCHCRNDNDSNPAGAEMKHSYRPLDILLRQFHKISLHRTSKQTSTNPWELSHSSPQPLCPRLPSPMERNSTTTPPISKTFTDLSILLKSQPPPSRQGAQLLHRQQLAKTGQINPTSQSIPKPNDPLSNIGKSTPSASAGMPHGKAFKHQHTSWSIRST